MDPMGWRSKYSGWDDFRGETIIFSSESSMFNQNPLKKGQTFEQKLQQQSTVSLVGG